MEAALVVETPATGVRERLVAFMDGISAGLAHARWRERACAFFCVSVGG